MNCRLIFNSSFVYEPHVELSTAIIRNGRIATVMDMADIQQSIHKEYKIKFQTPVDCCRFAKEDFVFSEINQEKTRVKVKIDDSEINRLIQVLAGYDIRYISEVKQTLEDLLYAFL